MPTALRTLIGAIALILGCETDPVPLRDFPALSAEYFEATNAYSITLLFKDPASPKALDMTCHHFVIAKCATTPQIEIWESCGQEAYHYARPALTEPLDGSLLCPPSATVFPICGLALCEHTDDQAPYRCTPSQPTGCEDLERGKNPYTDEGWQ